MKIVFGSLEFLQQVVSLSELQVDGAGGWLLLAHSLSATFVLHTGVFLAHVKMTITVTNQRVGDHRDSILSPFLLHFLKLPLCAAPSVSCSHGEQNERESWGNATQG